MKITKFLLGAYCDAITVFAVPQPTLKKKVTESKNAAHRQHSEKVSYLVRSLLAWFSINARDLPWRRARDPYAIWVSEIMLQQTQVKTVIPYWTRWMSELPTISALAKAPPDRIHKLWEGLGYYTRVRNMHKAAENIVTKHGGSFPTNFDDILVLPGIGRYTAGAICSIAFNTPTPILDGNVIRILTRIFGIGANPRNKEINDQLWALAGELVQRSHDFGPVSKRSGDAKPFNCSSFNQAMMELGALICTPREPQCAKCPVKSRCVAFNENSVAELPNLGERATATARRFVAYVIKRGNQLLVRQRPAGVVNAHLWEFPNVEITGEQTDSSKQFTGEPTIKSLCQIKHSITRYRITVDAVLVCNAQRHSFVGTWIPVEKLEELAFTSAHRKIIDAFKKQTTPQ